MGWHLLTVFVHFLVSILWFGYVLFWTILIGPVAKEGAEGGAPRVLALVNRAPWPPKQIPLPFRLTFAQVGWGLLILLAATGVLLLGQRGITVAGFFNGEAFADRFGGLLAAKLLFVAGLVVLQFRVASRPGRWVVYANLAGAFLVAGLSVFLAR